MTGAPPQGRSITSMTLTLHESNPVVALVVNGDDVEAKAKNLADLLDELGYGNAKVATAVNGEFVPAGERSELQLSGADRVEIVAPRQGG